MEKLAQEAEKLHPESLFGASLINKFCVIQLTEPMNCISLVIVNNRLHSSGMQ